MQNYLGFKILRHKAGLRQMDIARELDVTESQVTKWETGRAMPSEEECEQLASLLGVRREQLELALGVVNK